MARQRYKEVCKRDMREGNIDSAGWEALVEARSDWRGTVRSYRTSNGKRGESPNSRGHILRPQNQAQRSPATTTIESVVLELVCKATANAATHPLTKSGRKVSRRDANNNDSVIYGFKWAELLCLQNDSNVV